MKLSFQRGIAKKLGISLHAYQTYTAQGLKRCGKCRLWQDISGFHADKSSSDSLQARCKACLATRHSQTYVSKSGRRRRSSIKVQARDIINKEVLSGSRKQANALLCSDCGQSWVDGLPRHEYHHHLGYELDFQTSVVPLCQPCHRKAHDAPTAETLVLPAKYLATTPADLAQSA